MDLESQMEITGAGGELQTATIMRRHAVRPGRGRKARDECIKESGSKGVTADGGSGGASVVQMHGSTVEGSQGASEWSWELCQGWRRGKDVPLTGA
jgi:hypothetical protein